MKIIYLGVVVGNGGYYSKGSGNQWVIPPTQTSPLN